MRQLTQQALIQQCQQQDMSTAERGQPSTTAAVLRGKSAESFGETGVAVPAAGGLR